MNMTQMKFWWNLRDRWICIPNNTPVIYAPSGRELCAGQHMSVPGRQLSLYEWLTTRNFSQLGPYTTPTSPRLMTNVSQNIEED